MDDLEGNGWLSPPGDPAGPLGSPGFVAPEIVQEGPHAPSMDVFSAGVILFILLVGRKPFHLKDSSTLAYTLKPLSSAPGLQSPRYPRSRALFLCVRVADPGGVRSICSTSQMCYHSSVSTKLHMLTLILACAAAVLSVKTLWTTDRVMVSTPTHYFP
jgi:serine/threonine protein kinase